LLDEAGHHLVEQLDLLVRITARAGHEQLGDAPQRFGALPDVAVREGVLELLDQVFLRTHRVNPHSPRLMPPSSPVAAARSRRRARSAAPRPVPAARTGSPAPA